MDFKQLMNLASQNKAKAKKQDTKEVTAKNSDSKSNKSGVSDAAVKAFLEKKELEKKRKAAEEDAARRARIEERLAKSLGTKKKDSGKGATSSQQQKNTFNSCMTSREHSDKKNEKQKAFEHVDTKTPHQPSSKKPDTDRTRCSLERGSKNTALSSKKSDQKSHGSGKKSGPLDFKALLAMAEKNKNGGAKILPSSEHVSSVKQEERKEGERHINVKKSSLEQDKVVDTGHGKTLKDGKTCGQMQSKESSKKQDKGNAGKKSSVGDSHAKQDLKRSSGLVNGNKEKELSSKASSSVNGSREKGLVSKASSSIPASASHGKLLSNSKGTHPRIDRRPPKEGQFGKRRDRDALKRKRNPYVDDLDDFIDDGDGDDVDVSKYIKEIFGYDKSRYRDDDDDLATMESSYSQIEKEESRSSKIARLEDEIEQLKELHELKKQKDKLKKSKK